MTQKIWFQTPSCKRSSMLFCEWVRYGSRRWLVTSYIYVALSCLVRKKSVISNDQWLQKCEIKAISRETDLTLLRKRLLSETFSSNTIPTLHRHTDPMIKAWTFICKASVLFYLDNVWSKEYYARTDAFFSSIWLITWMICFYFIQDSRKQSTLIM